MRTLLFLRSQESHFCDPQAIAAKVRHLASSAGLRLIEFSTEEEERAVVTSKLLAVLCPRLCEGPWASECGGKGESKDSLERSSFTADANTGAGLRQRNTARKRQILRAMMEVFRTGTVESLAARGQNCKD